jgi:hypothetical protein
MQLPIVLGIDPGVTGAIAFVKGNPHKTVVRNLPVIDRTYLQTYSKRLDVVTFYSLLETELREVYTPCKNPPMVLVAEQMQSMGFKTPARTLTMLAEMSGDIETAVRLWCWNHNIPLFVRKIQPRTWVQWAFPDSEKRSGRKSEAKEESLIFARKLFPDCEEDLRRKKDNDRAEALLLSFIGIAELSGCIVDRALNTFSNLAAYYTRFSQNGKNQSARVTDVYCEAATAAEACRRHWAPEIMQEIEARRAAEEQAKKQENFSKKSRKRVKKT